MFERYPVILTEDEASDGEPSATEIAPQAEIRATEIVDLDQWIIAVDKVNPGDQTVDEIDRQIDATEPEAAAEEDPPFELTQEAAISWTHFRQSEQAQLAFSFG